MPHDQDAPHGTTPGPRASTQGASTPGPGPNHGPFGSLTSNPVFQRYASALNRSIETGRSMANTQARALSQHVDEGVQQASSHAINVGRDRMKLDHSQDYWPQVKLPKMAFNLAVDVVADNSQRIAKGATGFADGVAGKMLEGTLDRVNPMHLATAAMHPHLAKRYVAQQLQWMQTPFDFSRDPLGFASTKWDQAKNSLRNAHDHYASLEGGFGDKLAHGGRALVDLTQEKLAPMIGMGMGTMALFAMPKQRKNTQMAMDRMFPKDRFYGRTARKTVPRFLFSKPIARVVGNPKLSAGLATFSFLTNMGMNISASQELSQSNRTQHGRLVENNRELVGSAGHLDLAKSIKATRKS